MKQIPQGYPYGGKKMSLAPWVELLEMIIRGERSRYRWGWGK